MSTTIDDNDSQRYGCVESCGRLLESLHMANKMQTTYRLMTSDYIYRRDHNLSIQCGLLEDGYPLMKFCQIRPNDWDTINYVLIYPIRENRFYTIEYTVDERLIAAAKGLNCGLKYCGRVIYFASIITDIVRVYKAYDLDSQGIGSNGIATNTDHKTETNVLPVRTVRTLASIAGGWAGGATGASIGSWLGNHLGINLADRMDDSKAAVLLPPLGAVIGSLVGSVIGTTKTSTAADYFAQKCIDWYSNK
ncbi:uncharacterized protein LOC128959950 [Oppia nitens]|uniref:uncharacterized protein LOC128959950 n=1 Tax=Oppia nitens TaxID=1686743 RepID=UPI0023DA3A0B|nr:uncharacterized protein LOC128959950 [Oppia nitens]